MCSCAGYNWTPSRIGGDQNDFIKDLEQAVYASKIMSYTQGYMLFKAAAKEYQWNLNYGGIALMWRGGCIIRSAFLGKIKEAYDANPTLENLLLSPYFNRQIVSCPGGMAAGSGEGSECRHSHTCHVQRTGILRWLPARTPACQPAASAA